MADFLAESRTKLEPCPLSRSTKERWNEAKIYAADFRGSDDTESFGLLNIFYTKRVFLRVGQEYFEMVVEKPISHDKLLALFGELGA